MKKTKNFKRLYKYLSENSTPLSILEIKMELDKLKPELIINDDRWNKSHELIFLVSEIDNTTIIKEIVFKCKPGFHLFINKIEENQYSIKIVYNVSQKDEVLFYIKQIKKLNK
jgi:hypothetical protein